MDCGRRACCSVTDSRNRKTIQIISSVLDYKHLRKSISRRVDQHCGVVCSLLKRTTHKFFLINGSQWAEAFSYNAFFSLFPLMILIVTIASTFTSWETAGSEVINYIEGIMPLSVDMQTYIFDTVASVMKTRGQASAVAFLILIWVINSKMVF